MRPTLKQLYNDPLTIIAALEQAGMENAHAKVMGIMVSVCEYWSMHRYYSRLDRDRRQVLQSEYIMSSRHRKPFDSKNHRRNRKQASEYDRTLIVSRSYLNRVSTKLEAKIAKWPELDLDPDTLRKKPDIRFVSKLLKSKMKRRQPRTLVLG